MLVAVRHGSTKDNGAAEKFRGWHNLPLSPQGQQEAEATASKLKKYNFPIDSYHTSTLKRAVQTSNEIGDALDVNFDKTDQLKDWNIGDFEGKPVKPNLDKIHSYINNMDKVIPGGESFQSFLDRVMPFLKSMVEDDKNQMVVTHNRVVTLLKALSEGNGKNIPKSVLKKKGPIEPGGIMIVNPDWSIDIVDGHAKSET